MKKFLKYIFISILVIFLIIIGYVFFVNIANLSLPEHTKFIPKKKQFVDSSTYKIDNCWFHKEQDGIWSLYLEGDPLERGYIAGVLTDSLVVWQERVFINQLHKIIPSNTYLSFLKYLIVCFNVNIHNAIPEENKEEIYGISQSATHEFDFIGTPYQRILNYHGAHDLGHMLQNLGMIACTSFAVWDEKTSDGNLLVGRNFDFYFGDDFSKEKIIAFVRPDTGYCHAFITWGGMMGAVSGMNEMGLTVTINAANSDIYLKTATPVSILARNILQYASDIKDAIKITEKYKIFVSEQFLIGSAKDNKAIVIEKTPHSQAVYFSKTNYIISTNHFQSEEFIKDFSAIRQRNNTPSGYRFRKVEELISQRKKLNYLDIAKILRDTAGLGSNSIGLGNELAINQLIAHHSIIFYPQKKIFWISTSPYQLGEYLAFDLNKVFDEGVPSKSIKVRSVSFTIPADSSFIKNQYKRYLQFFELKKILLTSQNQNISNFISLNPKFFHTYEIAGDYYVKKGDYQKSLIYFTQALKCELPGLNEKRRLVKKYTLSKKHLN